MITPSHCPRSGSSNPSRSPPKGDGQALCHPWTAQGARPAAGASQGLLLGRSAVLLGPAQRVLTYLHSNCSPPVGARSTTWDNGARTVGNSDRRIPFRAQRASALRRVGGGERASAVPDR